MDGSPAPAQAKDRPFEAARLPRTPSAQRLVDEVLSLLDAVDKRQRKRRVADAARHRQVITALVCDLAHRWILDGDAWITVEMSKAALGAKARRAPFMTEKFPAEVAALAVPGLGLAELRKGSRNAFKGIRSTLRAGPWLRARVDALCLSTGDLCLDPTILGEPLLLKGFKHKPGGKAKAMPLPDTDEVRQLRDEMHALNAWLAQADIGWAGDEEADRVDLGRRSLVRIFNNASLRFGGRLHHGFWLNLSKLKRVANLRIDGEPVVEVDFGQMSIRLAYAMVEAQPPAGDLYALRDYLSHREGIKRVLNALLASAGRPERFPAKTKQLFRQSERFETVLAAITRAHPELVPLFGTAKSLEFMYAESQVILAVLDSLRSDGITALPVHDCLIVPASKALFAKATMEQVCQDVTGVRGQAEISDPLGVLGRP